MAARPSDPNVLYVDTGTDVPALGGIRFCSVYYSEAWTAGSSAECHWPDVCARPDLPMNALVAKIEQDPAQLDSVAGDWVEVTDGFVMWSDEGGRLVLAINESRAEYSNYDDNTGAAVVRYSVKSGESCEKQCTTSACDDFSTSSLDGWTVVYGAPISGPPRCELVLPCAAESSPLKTEVRSVATMLYGVVEYSQVSASAWVQSPEVDTDCYFGLQTFIGDCHSAIVVDDGTLAVLYEDPTGNCDGDPKLQWYTPIPDWETLSLAPHDYAIRWDVDTVTLDVDGVETLVFSSASSGFYPPDVPLQVDVSCNLDGSLPGEHELSVDQIEVWEGENPFEFH